MRCYSKNPFLKTDPMCFKARNMCLPCHIITGVMGKKLKSNPHWQILLVQIRETLPIFKMVISLTMVSMHFALNCNSRNDI